MNKQTLNKSTNWYIQDFGIVTNPLFHSLDNGLFLSSSSSDTINFRRSDGDILVNFVTAGTADVSNFDIYNVSWTRISANTRHTVEFMVGGTGTFVGSTLYIRFFDSDENQISQLTQSFTASGAKKQVTRTFVTPSNTSFYEILISMNGNLGATARLSDYLLYDGDYLFSGSNTTSQNEADILVETVRNRFENNGLSFLPYQSLALKRFYENLLIELQGDPLPVILFVPGLSFDNSISSSVIAINLGTANVTTTLANTTAGVFSNGYSYQFDGTDDRLETNYTMPNNMTFLVKFNVVNVVGNQHLMAGSVIGQPSIRISGSTPQISIANVEVVSNGDVITANTNHVIAFNKNSSDIWNSWQFNGTVLNKFANNVTNAGTVNSDVKFGASAVSGLLEGSLFTTMLFNYVLSDLKTQRLINLIWL